MKFHHVKATADAATAAYTVPGKPILLGFTQPFKTTGTASALNAVYVESTGVLTISGLTSTDVIYFTLIY